MSGLGVLKWILGGIVPLLTIRTTLARAARPDDASQWPMLDLTEPIRRGSSGVRSLQNMLAIPLTSSGSPTFVPVPWASKYSTSAGLMPASLKSLVTSFVCVGPDGKVTPGGSQKINIVNNGVTTNFIR